MPRSLSAAPKWAAWDNYPAARPLGRAMDRWRSPCRSWPPLSPWTATGKWRNQPGDPAGPQVAALGRAVVEVADEVQPDEVRTDDRAPAARRRWRDAPCRRRCCVMAPRKGFRRTSLRDPVEVAAGWVAIRASDWSGSPGDDTHVTDDEWAATPCGCCLPCDRGPASPAAPLRVLAPAPALLPRHLPGPATNRWFPARKNFAGSRVLPRESIGCRTGAVRRPGRRHDRAVSQPPRVHTVARGEWSIRR